MSATSSVRFRRATALAVAGALALAACGSSKKASTATTAGATTTAAGAATTAAGATTTAGAATTAPATTAGGATTTVAAGSGRKLVIGETLAPPTLDITTGSGAAIPQALLYNVYETLVKVDDTGKYLPLLAKAWTISDDGLTYTFTLQSGVTFHNGDAFSSADVKASFDNDQANITAKKAPAIVSATFAPVDSVTAPDASTVVIKLKQRSREFLYNLTQTGGAIIDTKALADIATKPVGTGPFQFTNYTTNASLLLTRFDGYWGTKSTLASVEFRYFSDPTALAASIKSPDGVDIIDNLSTDLFKPFQTDSNFETVAGSTNGETILAINNSKAPLSDVRVRQAISYGIDKKAVNDIAEGGLAQIIGSHASPSDPWYKDLSGTYAYDPEKAKALLKDAGVSNLKLTLEVPPVPYAQTSSQVVKDQLGKIGISVTLDPIEFPKWIDQVFTQANYDLTIISHVEPRDIALYGNPNYYWRYNSPKVQQLLKDADAAPTDAASNALYQQVLDQINQDAVNDWFFELPRLEVVKKGITGYPKGSGTLAYDVTGISAS